MSDKKGKALALELMDDLLNEDAVEIEVEGEGATTVQSSSPPPPVAASKSAKVPVEPFDELSRSMTHPIEDIADDSTRPTAESHENATGDKTEISDPNAYEVRSAKPRSGEDKTERIQSSNLSGNQRGVAEDRVRASVGRFAPSRSAGPVSSTEAALAQSESLRIAQSRLLEFEQEIERLRQQNEELAAAGETLRRRTDELTASNQKRESDYQNLIHTFAQEKEILLNSKEALQRDLGTLRHKNEELELRISTNIQKIRVRERELENRLELVKMESAALIRSKDEMILEIKRNIDQLNLELNNYRTKNQELNRQMTDKQEQLRRTVKALRLALSMLEGEEEPQRQSQAPAAAVPLRKAK